jgi:hypothetical protein
MLAAAGLILESIVKLSFAVLASAAVKLRLHAERPCL